MVDFEDQSNTRLERIRELESLLREAVKIVHCHARNTDKDWLGRARAALRSRKKAVDRKGERGEG